MIFFSTLKGEMKGLGINKNFIFLKYLYIDIFSSLVTAIKYAFESKTCKKIKQLISNNN